MQFRARTKEAVLADLTSKLEELPASHPRRRVLARMIKGLQREIGERSKGTP